MSSRMRTPATALLSAALAVAAGAATAADCALGGIALVGAPIAIDTGGNDVSRVSAAWNADRGEYLVVWNYYADGAHRLYGKRVGGDGAPLGDAFEIEHDTNAIIDPVVAAATGHDRYLVAWQTQNTPFNGARGRMLDGTGAAQGEVFVISTAGAEPALVYNAPGAQFLLSGRRGGVEAQRIGLDGTLLGDVLALSTVDDGIAAPNGALAVNAAGQALGLWRDQENRRVAGRRLSPSGELVGTVTPYANEFPASGTAAQLDYRAADDRYVALYGLFDETALRWFSIGADGVGSTPQTLIEGSDLVAIGVAYDAATAATALFWTAPDGASTALFGQLLSSADTLENTPVRLLGDTSYFVKVAPARERGAALLAWPSANEVRGQRVAYGCLLADPIFADGFDGG